MRVSFRPVFTALSVACVISAASLASSAAAFAQDKPQSAPSQPAPAPGQAAPAPNQAAPAHPPAFKQVGLTDKQIDGVLAAQKEMDAIAEKLPENAAPDEKILSQLDVLAKKHGFANYDDYGNVLDNISLVLAGFDPVTKKYVGSEAVIKGQIAQVEADKKMSDKDRNEALGELNGALKVPPPAIENTGNIDVVARYYDKLMDAFGGDQD